MNDQKTYLLALPKAMKVIFGFFALLALGLVIASGWLVFLVGTKDSFLLAASVGLMCASVGLEGFIWMVWRPKKVMVSADRIWLPGPRFIAGKLHEVPLTELRYIRHQTKGLGATIELATDDKFFQLPQLYFRDADAYQSFCNLFHRRIRALPGGEELLKGERRDEQAFKSWKTRPTPVTYSVIALVLGVFVLEATAYPVLRLEGMLTPQIFMMLDMGGLWPPAVSNGEWGRIFMTSLLHTGLMHLFFNGVGLFIMGTILERYLGSWRVLTILLTSCLGGTAASMSFSPTSVVVGMSGGTLGLVVAGAYLQLTRQEALTPRHRAMNRYTLLRLIGLESVILLMYKVTTSNPHPAILLAPLVGGMVVGLVVTYLVVGPSRENLAARSNLVRAVAIGLAGLFLAGAGMRLSHFFADDGADNRREWVREQKRIAGDDSVKQKDAFELLLRQSMKHPAASEFRELVSLFVQNTSMSGEDIAYSDTYFRQNGILIFSSRERSDCRLDEPGERAWVKMYGASLPASEVVSYYYNLAVQCKFEETASVRDLEFAYQLVDEGIAKRDDVSVTSECDPRETLKRALKDRQKQK